MKRRFDQKRLHLAFEVSLMLKGVFSAAEVVAGMLTSFVTPQFVFDLVHALTRAELTEDPHDVVANYLLRAAQDLSLSSQHFAAFYLLSHGIIKLWLIIGLWRGKPGYYPAAIAVFGLFIVYQCYRYSFTQSPLLLFITVLDGVVVWLTWAEYRNFRGGFFPEKK